jgi:hypothetical protein
MREFKKVEIFLIGLAVFLLLAYGSQILRFVSGGRINFERGPQCAKGHLSGVEVCEEKRNPGAENAGGYYSIAKGKPRAEFCKAFLENVRKLNDKAGKACTPWSKTDCSKYPGLTDGECYTCNQKGTEGGPDFYFIAGFLPDCSQGLYFSSARYQPEVLNERIFYSNPDEAENE